MTPLGYALLWLAWLLVAALLAWLVIARPIVKELHNIRVALDALNVSKLTRMEPDRIKRRYKGLQ